MPILLCFSVWSRMRLAMRFSHSMNTIWQCTRFSAKPRKLNFIGIGGDAPWQTWSKFVATWNVRKRWLVAATGIVLDGVLDWSFRLNWCHHARSYGCPVWFSTERSVWPAPRHPLLLDDDMTPAGFWQGGFQGWSCRLSLSHLHSKTSELVDCTIQLIQPCPEAIWLQDASGQSWVTTKKSPWKGDENTGVEGSLWALKLADTSYFGVRQLAAR